jgi:hypothetical protein
MQKRIIHHSVTFLLQNIPYMNQPTLLLFHLSHSFNSKRLTFDPQVSVNQFYNVCVDWFSVILISMVLG